MHTARALVNFAVTGAAISQFPALIASLAAVKQAACQANRDLGLLDARRADAIRAACEEIRAGQLHDSSRLILKSCRRSFGHAQRSHAEDGCMKCGASRTRLSSRMCASSPVSGARPCLIRRCWRRFVVSILTETDLSWILAHPMDGGVHLAGALCPDEPQYVLARSTDDYVIWCVTGEHVYLPGGVTITRPPTPIWALYSP